ncbi:MAG: radical SAM protein [Deltaproteobacteria bacterium]|nr:radical SAM protein [Deltaproteobacteria bacterium]
MRILLTTPVSTTQYDYFRDLASRGVKLPVRSFVPTLALDYLKASLEDDNEVTLLRPAAFRALRKQLDHCDMVGITSTTANYLDALETAKRVKEARPDKLVVMGGPHVSIQDVETLEAGNVDVVVRGEGELTMQKLARSKPFEEIEGISYKREGKIVRNPSQQAPIDLHSLPFPRSDGWTRFLWFRRSFGAVVSSRGCPHNCSFCTTSALQGRKWRARSASNITKELEQFTENPYVFFMDDNFTMDPERVETLCDLIQERGFSFRWACLSRADSIASNEKLLRKMFDAGLIALLIGVESANPESLRDAHKRQTQDVIRNAFGLIKQYPIITQATMIFGFDSDTLESMDENIEFLLELDPTVIQASVLTPFPGTEIYSKYMAEDRIFTNDWSKYDVCHCVFQPKNFSPEQLEDKVSECYRRFYGSSRKRKERLRGLSFFLKGKL